MGNPDYKKPIGWAYDFHPQAQTMDEMNICNSSTKYNSTFLGAVKFPLDIQFILFTWS